MIKDYNNICMCGCGKKIILTKNHFERKRFPQYIRGHFLIGKPSINRKTQEERQRTLKNYLQRNKERIYLKQKEYNENHRKQVRAYKQKYKDNNKEKIAKARKLYREKNLTKHSIYRKQRYQQHKVKENACSVTWTNKNRDHVNMTKWLRRNGVYGLSIKNDNKELIKLYLAYQKIYKNINKDQMKGISTWQK